MRVGCCAKFCQHFFSGKTTYCITKAIRVSRVSYTSSCKRVRVLSFGLDAQA